MQAEDLEGLPLTAVAFVQDYLQLQFDGPVLTLYAWPEAFRDEGSYAYGEPEYRNVLCELIGNDVEAATLVEDEALEIRFVNGSSLRVSLREEERTGPEAGSLVSGEPGDEMLVF
ncbi:MAG: hypothetical protein KGK08_13595 [Acidobacteriota bacterium]|nr:hypothetical protein [Acidobacteriota bacterium]